MIRSKCVHCNLNRQRFLSMTEEDLLFSDSLTFFPRVNIKSFIDQVKVFTAGLNKKIRTKQDNVGHFDDCC